MTPTLFGECRGRQRVASFVVGPWVLMFAGVTCLVAGPYYLRVLHERGTWAIRPIWLVWVAVSLILAAMVWAVAAG